MTDRRFPFPDREACMEILKRDVCFGKIAPERVQQVFEDAWDTGEKAAQDYFAQGEAVAQKTMYAVLQEQGFTIDDRDEDYVSGEFRYFCEYVSGKNLVRIYRKAVALWAQKNAMSPEMALDLILAHEYFHHLEWHHLGMVSRHYLVPMLKIGAFALGTTGVPSLSEIAANSFANSYFLQRYANKINFAAQSEKENME